MFCARRRSVVHRAWPAEIFWRTFGWPANDAAPLRPAIEIIGGILLLVGAYTRVVTFILSGDTAAAY